MGRCDQSDTSVSDSKVKDGWRHFQSRLPLFSTASPPQTWKSRLGHAKPTLLYHKKWFRTSFFRDVRGQIRFVRALGIRGGPRHPQTSLRVAPRDKRGVT